MAWGTLALRPDSTGNRGLLAFDLDDCLQSTCQRRVVRACMRTCVHLCTWRTAEFALACVLPVCVRMCSNAPVQMVYYAFIVYQLHVKQVKYNIKPHVVAVSSTPNLRTAKNG